MNMAVIKKQIQQIEMHNQMLKNSLRNNQIMLKNLHEQLAIALAVEARHG